MIHLGLIGYPLGHSLSPKIHAAALNACGLQGDYSLFPIRPDDQQGLKYLLDRVRSGEITGLNVTIPHKQNVMPHLDELTNTARSIGAVNTISLKDNRLIGDNTDAQGFLSDVKKFLTLEFDSKLSNTREQAPALQKNALVLGAGGSARAVVYALAHDGWSVAVAARRMEKARELALQFENARAVEFNPQTFQLSNIQLIVNTTPLGMLPNVDQSPLPENLSLSSNISIYDLVYNPRVTKLVKDARKQGLNATTGLGMLIEQAALAFEIWTGCNPPRDVLWKCLEN